MSLYISVRNINLRYESFRDKHLYSNGSRIKSRSCLKTSFGYRSTIFLRLLGLFFTLRLLNLESSIPLSIQSFFSPSPQTFTLPEIWYYPEDDFCGFLRPILSLKKWVFGFWLTFVLTSVVLLVWPKVKVRWRSWPKVPENPVSSIPDFWTGLVLLLWRVHDVSPLPTYPFLVDPWSSLGRTDLITTIRSLLCLGTVVGGDL